MSKLKRNPAERSAESPERTGASPEPVEPQSSQASPAAATEPTPALARPAGLLAKVETNDETPRCPFCKSARLEPMAPNQFGRKWVCLDCCVQFREAITIKGAA